MMHFLLQSCWVLLCMTNVLVRSANITDDTLLRAPYNKFNFTYTTPEDNTDNLRATKPKPDHFITNRYNSDLAPESTSDPAPEMVDGDDFITTESEPESDTFLESGNEPSTHDQFSTSPESLSEPEIESESEPETTEPEPNQESTSNSSPEPEDHSGDDTTSGNAQSNDNVNANVAGNIGSTIETPITYYCSSVLVLVASFFI